jgi:O-antigen/teichoic acid export membrane protein
VGVVADVSASELPDARSDRLRHSAAALIISNGTGAVLGVGFWAAAARLYPAKDVGAGVAEVSAMLLLASLSQLNLGIVFPRFLFAAGAKATSLVRLGYGASMAVAFVLTGIFLLFWPHSYIETGMFPTLFFLAAVVLWVVFSIQDAALIGLRATFWVPVENTSFSIAKIALLPAFVTLAPHQGVFLSWVLPVLICIGGITTFLFTRVLPDHVRWSAGRASLPTRRSGGHVLAGEWVAGLAYIALATMPALIITWQLGLTAAAHFQTPWLAGTSVDFMLYYIATSVISESSARASDAPNIVRRATRFTGWLLVPAAACLVVGARWLLELQGGQYASQGTHLLQLLALALPFLGVNVLFITFARLSRRVRKIVALPACVTAIVLTVSTLLMSRFGITAVGIGFLTGQASAAVIVLPSVVRQYRRPNMSPGFAPDRPLVAKGSTPLDAVEPSLNGSLAPEVTSINGARPTHATHVAHVAHAAHAAHDRAVVNNGASPPRRELSIDDASLARRWGADPDELAAIDEFPGEL